MEPMSRRTVYWVVRAAGVVGFLTVVAALNFTVWGFVAGAVLVGAAASVSNETVRPRHGELHARLRVCPVCGTPIRDLTVRRVPAWARFLYAVTLYPCRHVVRVTDRGALVGQVGTFAPDRG